MTDNTFTEVHHPKDPVYMRRRRMMIDKLLPLSKEALDRQIEYQSQQPPPADQDSKLARQIVRELRHSDYVPDRLKGILDSSGATTGNVLIRQDLEASMYALFVKKFPLFDRLRKLPSNGLTKLAPAA